MVEGTQTYSESAIRPSHLSFGSLFGAPPASPASPPINGPWLSPPPPPLTAAALPTAAVFVAYSAARLQPDTGGVRNPTPSEQDEIAIRDVAVQTLPGPRRLGHPTPTWSLPASAPRSFRYARRLHTPPACRRIVSHHLLLPTASTGRYPQVYLPPPRVQTLARRIAPTTADGGFQASLAVTKASAAEIRRVVGSSQCLDAAYPCPALPYLLPTRMYCTGPRY